MPKMISLTIDGRPVSAPEGTLIVNAAKSIGIDIPVFCYHPKMEPVGMCRQCLVEVGRPLVDRATGHGSFNILAAPNTTGGAGFVGDYDGLVPTTGSSFGSAFVMATPIATAPPTDLFFNSAP